MKENKLTELSMEFSVDIINIVKQLKENRESIISNQIGRSVVYIIKGAMRPCISSRASVYLPAA